MHSLLGLTLGLAFRENVATYVILFADTLGVLTVPSVLIRRGGRPRAALAWILALLALPFVGVLLWWLLGRDHLARQRRRRALAREQRCGHCAPPDNQRGHADTVMRRVVPFALQEDSWEDGVSPPTPVASARLLRDGPEAFGEFEAAIADAQTSVSAMFYIWQDDATGRRIRDLLVQRARAGVDVRVLVDAVGSSRFLRRSARSMRASGVRVAAFLPVRFRPWAPTFNFRNHRKLLLIDDDVAFAGGMNIGDEYAESWHDFAVRIEGPALRYLRDVFEDDWCFATGDSWAPPPAVDHQPSDAGADTCTIIASGPDRAENRMHDAFFLAVAGAAERVWLTSPYFIPSRGVQAALRGAAQRGVDVRILTPGQNDLPLVGLASRSYYRPLLDAGVRIFEYRGRTLHAKALVVDGELAVLGSANADARSFKLNFELGCFFASEQLNSAVAGVFKADLLTSEEVDVEVLERAPMRVVLAQSLAHLLSPLL